VAVLVRIGKQKAILRDAQWRCALASLEADLNQFTKRWVQREAVAEELRGDLEQAISLAVADRYSAKVLLRTNPVKRGSRNQYFQLRQLNLFDL
jgi:hypothetical protein